MEGTIGGGAAQLVASSKPSSSQRTSRIIFEQVAGDALALFGYSLERARSTHGNRLRNLYFATVARY